MTAYTGANIREGGDYWELSGPSIAIRTATCRGCKKRSGSTIYKGDTIMVRDGRKLRFFYHEECFTGDADPRTQMSSSFQKMDEYHHKTAPK